MKHLRYLLLAALVAMPLTACDEDTDTPTDTTQVIYGTVSGTVSAEGTGLSGVSVTLVGATTMSATTASGGAYTFSNVPAGSYGVSIDASTHSDVSFSQTSKSTSIATSGQTATVDFSGSYIRTASIQGVVIAGDQGVVGVTATLTGGPDSVNKTAQTNAGGEFTFTGLRAGDYTVVISNLPDDVSFATTSNNVTISTVGESVTTAFAGNLLEPATISGVVLADGAPLGQVTVTLTMGSTAMGTTLTNAAGEFMFGDLEPGTYTVTISGYDMTRYDFTTTSYDITVGYGDNAVRNFGGEGNTAAVSIERITLPNGNAANRSAIAGMIVVEVGVDQGGEDITNLTVTLNGVQFGEQDYGRSVAGAEKATDDKNFEVDFPVNTAMTMAGPPFTPTWFNGVNTIVATATTADGDMVTATEDITLVNVDLLALSISAMNPGNGDVDTLIDPVTGLRWLSGSLTFNLYPIIYSSPFDPNDPPIARANMMFDAFCSAETLVQGNTRPTIGAAATQMTYALPWTTAAGPQADGHFTWTMSDAVNCRTSTMGADDLITGWMGAQDFTINTVTQHGQPGPGAFCPNISTTCVGTGGTVAANPLLFYFNDELQSGTGAINNFLRVDNQEPYAGTVDLDPHPLWSSFSGSITANYPAWIDVNGIDLLRGGANLNGLRDGWVNHAYPFDTGMWQRTNGTGFYATRTATDAPNVYPANTLFSAGYPAITPVGANVVVPGAALMGIGLTGTAATDFAGYYAVASDNSNATAASAITGIGTARQRLVSATAANMVSTGADLPGENCLGCATLPAPNTNEWDDISITAIVVDQFFNAGYTNVFEAGVDGKAPVMGTITYPTVAGTVYNTYGTVDSYGDLKVAGTFTASTTDSGNGFSGVAGVSMLDVENGCVNAGEMACASGTFNTRTGVQLQLLPTNPATVTLVWNWALAGTTFFNGATPYAAVAAYDAVLGTYAVNDGYRQQTVTTWDRAANSFSPDATKEHIADKAIPVFGNVTMPGDPLFVNGTSYTFLGQVNDGNTNPVDLDFVDLGFDFNGITTVQTYIDPVVGTPQRPNPDINNWQYRATSLQLPLRVVDETSFGSASIVLQDNALSENIAFLGCLVRFDELGLATLTTHPALAGLEPIVHRPRGPRWRVWDHAMGDVLIDGAAGPNNYPLVNTQYNTFVLTSLPACSLTPAAMAAITTPAFSAAGAWAFGIGAHTGGASLELAVYGPSGTFVPSFSDLSAVDLYYIDVSGRARLLDPTGLNWSGPVVSDTGAGPTARAYVWTYSGTAPTDIDAAQQSGGYFFVWRFSGTNTGMGMIWDVNSN